MAVRAAGGHRPPEVQGNRDLSFEEVGELLTPLMGGRTPIDDPTPWDRVRGAVRGLGNPMHRAYPIARQAAWIALWAIPFDGLVGTVERFAMFFALRAAASAAWGAVLGAALPTRAGADAALTGAEVGSKEI